MAGRQALLTALDVLRYLDLYLVDVGAFGHRWFSSRIGSLLLAADDLRVDPGSH
jgi:hypothetical protein